MVEFGQYGEMRVCGRIAKQSWWKTPLSLDRMLIAWNSIAQETMNSLQNILPPDQQPIIIFTLNSVEFIRVCEGLLCNQDKSTGLPCTQSVD